MVSNPFDRSTYPSEVPSTMVQAYAVAWKKDYDFNSSVYSLRYFIRSLKNQTDRVVVNGVYDNAVKSWVFEADSTETLGWNDTFDVDTECRWELHLIRNSDQNNHIIETGFTHIYLTDSARQSHAEIMVSKIESILEGRADHDVESYTIRDRSLTRMSVEELRKHRDYYLAEIRRGGGSMKSATPVDKTSVRVRFV
jgi:hypothetical protein